MLPVHVASGTLYSICMWSRDMKLSIDICINILQRMFQWNEVLDCGVRFRTKRYSRSVSSLAIKHVYCIVPCSHDCSRNLAATTVRPWSASMPLAKYHLPVCGDVRHYYYLLVLRLGAHCMGYKRRGNSRQQRQLPLNCQGAGKWSTSIKPVLRCWPSYNTMSRCSGNILLVIFHCWYVVIEIASFTTHLSVI